ncbi:MAG: glucosaminidase domain-containing protein [Ferruginibacter sp.]
MRKILIIFFCCCINYSVTAQSLTPEQYILTYKDLAISEQKRLGIPAAITLAQGLLETESGNSLLVKQSNNHFGIKCKSNWTGETVFHDDDARGECFRKYNTAEESYRDHSDFLKNSGRYGALFQLQPTDYKGWAYGLKKAGYATNPKYPDILIKNIEQYNLQQYDNFDNSPLFDAGKVINEKKEEKTIAISAEEAAPKVTTLSKGSKTMANGLKAVFVLKGTSLLAIATENKISLSRLLEFNDLTTDGLLSEDQFIYLEKKEKQGKVDFFTSIENVCLYDVSQTLGIQLQELAKYNQLNSNCRIAKGSKLALRPGLQPLVILPTTAIKHRVEPKEGLYTIARKYNVSVQDLKAWNNLNSEELKTGQQILISK